MPGNALAAELLLRGGAEAGVADHPGDADRHDLLALHLRQRAGRRAERPGARDGRLEHVAGQGHRSVGDVDHAVRERAGAQPAVHRRRERAALFAPAPKVQNVDLEHWVTFFVRSISKRTTERKTARRTALIPRVARPRIS